MNRIEYNFMTPVVKVNFSSSLYRIHQAQKSSQVKSKITVFVNDQTVRMQI